MEWLREWIWQIVGIIILSAVCDMIVPGGEMKKYVKLVMGLVLVVAVIRPIINLPTITLAEMERAETQRNATELKNRLTEREQFNVIKIYKEKVCQNIENKLSLPKNVSVDVKVEVEEEDDKEFGNITSVTVLVYSDGKIEDVNNSMKNTITEEFGVRPENIRIVMLSEQQKTV